MLKEESLLHSLAMTAEKYLDIKEEGVNRGSWVDKLNQKLHSPLGSPWCAAFACACVLEVCEDLGATSPLVISTHVRTLVAKNQSILQSYPFVGAIVCWGLEGGDSGHCGIVIEVDPEFHTFKTVEGNTDNKDTIEREGGCVAKQTRPNHDVGRFKLLGFIKAF